MQEWEWGEPSDWIFSHWRPWEALENVGQLERMFGSGESAGVWQYPSSIALRAPSQSSPQAQPPQSRGQRGASPALVLTLPLPGATGPSQMMWVPLCRASPRQWVPVTLPPTGLWLQPCTCLDVSYSSPKTLVPTECPSNALVLHFSSSLWSLSNAPRNSGLTLFL